MGLGDGRKGSLSGLRLKLVQYALDRHPAGTSRRRAVGFPAVNCALINAEPLAESLLALLQDFRPRLFDLLA